MRIGTRMLRHAVIALALLVGCARRSFAAHDGGTASADAGTWPGDVDAGTSPIDGGSSTGDLDGGVIPFTGDLATGGRICSVDHWCWYNPLPQGNPFNSVWGSGPDDVWAVGDHGTIFHWDGSRLDTAPMDAPDDLDLTGIWGDAPDDVWAIGTKFLSGPGTILHWDGRRWSTSRSVAGALEAVAGSGRNDVWAVGTDADSGLALHWTGAGWRDVATPLPLGFVSVTSHAPDDAWAVGPGVSLAHWDGTTWSTVLEGSGLDSYNGVWSDDAGAPWVASELYGQVSCDSAMIGRWDGQEWSPQYASDYVTCQSAESFRAVWGTGQTDVWGAGDQGTVVHWDGSSWTTVSHQGDGGPLLNGGWSGGPGDTWVVGRRGTMMHLAQGAWRTATTGAVPTLSAVWADGPDDAWAVGTTQGPGARAVTLHWDGTRWSDVPNAMTSPNDDGPNAVWGSGSGDVWVAGYAGHVHHWDGSRWSEASIGGWRPGTGPHFFGLWGSGPNDVWCVGDAVEHWDGTSWSAVSAPPGTLNAVSGSGANDVWAVGESPQHGSSQIDHWDGHAWSIASTLPLGASAVWAASAADVWIVGSNSVGPAAAHWDGRAWSLVPTAPAIPGAFTWLTAVWGSGPGDVWASGSSGRVMHWNGTAWAAEDGGTFNDLHGIFGSGAGDVWAVGDDGTILRQQP